jgi:quinol monooxygenase YgiN
MSDTPVVLNVVMQAAPGREEELETQLTALVAPTLSEPGCLTYVLHRDREDRSKFMFYEKFASQAALDAHLASGHFQKFATYKEKNGDPAAVTTVTRWTPIS